MRRTRNTTPSFLLLTAAITLVDAASLQSQNPAPDITSPEIEPRPEPIIQQHDLTITPAGPPTPLLKYELLPPLRERKPGNRAPYYLRAIVHWSATLPDDVRDRFEEVVRKNDYRLRDFSAAEVRELLPSFKQILRQLERAAVRDFCDWNLDLESLEGWDAISISVEEFQRARDLTRLLVLKGRLEVAEGRFDDAIRTLQVGYQLARDSAEPSTLINSLVGIAMTTMLNTIIVDWIDRPDSPNLYWALATRPRPFIPIRKHFHFEAALPERMFPVLRDPESAVRPAEEWDSLTRQLVVDLEHIDTYWKEERVTPTAERLEAADRIIAEALPIARRELQAAGFDPDQLGTMPDGQVLAIHTSRFSREHFDRLVALLDVPPPLLDRFLIAFDEETARIRASTTTADRRESLPVFDRLQPSLGTALIAWLRPQLRLDALQCLEAIRAYATTHDGELPETLDDIVDTPFPKNIHTGRPFDYRREGDQAVLTIPFPYRKAHGASPIVQEYTFRVER